MLLSPSGLPAPADSPSATSPPSPPLPLLQPPFAAPPLSSPQPPPLAPTPSPNSSETALAPVVSPPLSPPQPPVDKTPPSPPSSPLIVASPPSIPPPITSETPPLPPLPAKTPPTLPPHHPQPLFPPPAASSPPLLPDPSPKPPSLLPETSPTPPVLPKTPLPSSAPSPKPPASTLPFFGPLPEQPVFPSSPPGQVIVPKNTPVGLPAVASPPQLLPLVPKSLPDTATSHQVSTGLVFGGVIGGVLLLVLLGLLFVCYRATRNGGNESSKGCNSKAPRLEPKESSDPEGAHVITVRPQPFNPPLHTSGSSYNISNDSSGSINKSQTRVTTPTLNISSGTFMYNELVAATNGFSEANLLGQGGFGYVHKGVLPNGKEVAVKQLKIGSHQGEREFQAEVDTISRVHHKHLVSLVGYCIIGAKRLLVYEFVPNNTLEFHLDGKGARVLDWETRLRIAIGSAKGLSYLHEDCNPTIIHRDIKAANILLDSNFEAKVSDFGLAKFFSDTNSSITHVSTRVLGTFGYMAPEYASSGKLTDKSDVYSFGVMLLELITGRPPITIKESSLNESLVDWARPLLTKALEDGNFDTLADPNLQTHYDETQMASMIACAAACIRQSSWLRPRMSQIVRALEGQVSLPDFDNGITPGHSTSYNSSQFSSHNTQQHRADMRRFNAILADGTSGHSGSTSEYGLNPSFSSSEGRQTISR